jgi:O-antigen/teichoic acid export membrane protein
MHALTRLRLIWKAQIRVRRICLGVGSSALAQLIAALQAIILVPLFLRAWGADAYSQWLTLTALISYLSLLDLGGQNYIGNLLAVYHARGDAESFQNALSEGISLFAFVGSLALLVLGCVMWVFTRIEVPGLARPFASSELLVLGFLSANYLLFSIPGGVYATAYRATGLFSRGAMVSNLVRLISLIMCVGLLYWTATAPEFAAGLFGTGVVLTSVIIWDTRRCIPECRKAALSLCAARNGYKHLKGALYFWVMSLAQAITQQGVILVLAATDIRAAAAVYSTHRTLANIPGYMRILVQGPLLPELSYCWAHGRLSEIWDLTRRSIRLLVMITGCCSLLLWLSAADLYPIWTGRKLTIQPVLLGVLLVQGVLAAGWQTSTWGLLAANRHRSAAIASLANAVLGTGLAIVLVKAHGLVGVAVAGLASDLVFGVCVLPILVASFLGLSPWRIPAEIGTTCLLLVPVAVLAGYLGHAQHNWLLQCTWLIGASGITMMLGFRAGTTIMPQRLSANTYAIFRRLK